MSRASKLLVVLSITFAAAGCRQEKPPAPALDYTRELPPGKLALRKLSPAEYPDFSVMQTSTVDLSRSAANSASYLAAPSSQRYFPYLDITHDQALETARDLQRLAARGNIDWNAEIRSRYDVYQSIGAPSNTGDGYSGELLFTGYFTPIYDASIVRTGPYQWPLYKRPADLVTDDTGERASRRQVSPGGAPPRQPPPGAPEMIPLAADSYWTRAEIERDGKLAGQELVWLKSRWEAYVVTVQGSAILRLTDGRRYEIGFAGSNGRPYVSPGRQMIADGVISKDQLSLRGLAKYFAEHPEQMDRYLWMNPRTTFFTERRGGPFGKLNVPVTPFASIATDKEVYPRAMPAYVVTNLARSGGESVRHRGIAFDQDAGGAIRSAGRCDIYMGIGPAAEELAGHQLSPGHLYYLALKKEQLPQRRQ